MEQKETLIDMKKIPVGKKEAKEVLMTWGRNTIKPEYAKEITEAFGLVFNEKLIRTGKNGYREWSNEKPRVDVTSLSEDICKQLGKKPDEKTLETAGMMSGEGSYRDLLSKAYAKNL
ncbi:hypothetical protein CL617_00610 [archaeon]|nr:hypothetical protein [archaeon]|tara:strand:- start:3119 stop:3469 length:351 start_codon:yes stop_codon:yes gene_type:complete